MCRIIITLIVALAILGVGPTRLQARESGNGAASILVPLLPGIAAHDPRRRLDPEKIPWRAIGKLQAATLNFRVACTGTVVGPGIVLTAARCVYNPRTQHYVPPTSLHFLIGSDGSRYAGHAIAIKVETGPGYDPTRRGETIGSDWALISSKASSACRTGSCRCWMNHPRSGALLCSAATSRIIG
jgi:protease YdgD